MYAIDVEELVNADKYYGLPMGCTIQQSATFAELMNANNYYGLPMGCTIQMSGDNAAVEGSNFGDIPSTDCELHGGVPSPPTFQSHTRKEQRN